MKVYVFNSEHPMVRGDMTHGAGYCGVTACLLEGLRQLGVSVTAANQGLHVRQTGTFRADFDWYIVQRSSLYNHAETFRLLERHGCLDRTAFIDGHDYAFGPDFFWLHSPATYFLKENYGEYDVHTMPFGIEDRFLPRVEASDTERRPRVMFSYRYETHPGRAEIRRELLGAGLDVVCDWIEDPPHKRGLLHWQTGRRHNEAYYRALAACRVGVAAEGEAVDTLRYWEFAASNAVLVSPRVEEIIADFPAPPTPDQHYVPYCSAEDASVAVEEALDRYEVLLPQQREFFLAHHRSVHRARRFLEIMKRSQTRIGEGHGRTEVCLSDA